MAKEATGDVAEKAAPQASPVVLTEQVKLVEFASKIWLVRVCVPLAFCKANQFATRVFDDEAEPTPVRRLKRLSPLILASSCG